MQAEIRKVVVYEETLHREGGQASSPRLRLISSAIVMANPWKGYSADLRTLARALAPSVSALLIEATLARVGKAEHVEAIGKAAVVGTSGEVEHAAAMIHTLWFGNAVRDAFEGTSFLPFTNKRGGPGCSITIPLKHKIREQEGSRGHFLTSEFSIPDAPAPEEMVVAISVATGPRPNHRIGDRYQDMEDLSAHA
ncbi:amino acid synthesis family protein [Mesorhizobium sp. CAU 1741]|uniref:amino acid synthesis family protein n=1 Tax=Mesorhizobium sp. CAU 1741 TaxID=3140366 RepID=UPI00325BDBA2